MQEPGGLNLGHFLAKVWKWADRRARRARCFEASFPRGRKVRLTSSWVFGCLGLGTSNRVISIQKQRSESELDLKYRRFACLSQEPDTCWMEGSRLESPHKVSHQGKQGLHMCPSSIWLLPAGYAFIEFEHERDLKNAYKQGDGKKIDGRQARRGML